LTTFNEVDLGELLALRARHRERFKARHGVDLGLMSLFARAVIHGLREVPILNARIDGTDVVKPRHVHLGIAVSTPRGLVVPVARGGQVVIRPMMYVALSYDHRLVDGEQAVTFLVRVKEALEDPARMVLEV